ncbi:cytochrome c family protein [Chelatococcus daeguensis]|uniref:c-type cytochrome n=1 Tax=Chelatococcus daeguensis TaxID=444444 RepID=UPI0007ABA514|nr:cytochrome c family protein [Chelatococcus daeguensis]KZE33697.1 cytochrome C [Chelatococcus daeguensis]MBM3082768.1 cytochrome c family protein [Chelatococcus daeguensis]
MTRLLPLACAAMFLLIPRLAVAQDAQAGKRVFNKCSACHAVGPNAPNKIGPQLNGLFGRTAGSVEGYTYSPANKQSGITWTEETFANYIKDPRGAIKGTKMVFAGIRNEQEVRDLTAYLRSFAADGEPQ